MKAALLIGISEYQEPLQNLASAVLDVEALATVLQDPQIGEFDEITPLFNEDRQRIEEAIYDFFTNRTADDLLLFYFSGHGILDRSGRLYLATPITSKGSEGLVIPTAVNTAYIRERMSASYSKRQVLILDCCHSGAIDQGLRKDDASINISQQLGGKGRAILTSSDSLEYSYEQKEGSLSVYTYYLVEGIRTGAADANGDGWITVEELHDYTRRKVQEESPSMTPQFFRDQEADTINLARASQSDPKLMYRKVVDEIALENEGDLDDPIDRLFLDERYKQLGLEEQEARQIESEVIQPWQERQKKLEQYEQALTSALQRHSPLTDRARRKLQRLQDEYKLRDEDVDPIRSKLASRSPQITAEDPTSTQPEEPDYYFSFDVVTVDPQGQITERRSDRARQHIEALGQGICLEMVYIPAGSFLMGSPDGEGDKDERPQHTVTVQPFFLGKYPITQAQWQIVASWQPVERNLEPDPSHFKGSDRPVECVSWHDAVEFCKRLMRQTGRAYRLPSEAEWEYACRSNTTTPFHFGETVTTDLANYNGNDTYGSGPEGIYRKGTTEVGSFGVANAFGLYDMHGNVWEWCADPWHNSYENAPKNAIIWEEGGIKKETSRLLRGGSWFADPRYCRSAFRNHLAPDDRLGNIGFRVCCGSPR